MSSTRFEVFADTRGKFRWRLVEANGRIVAEGGQGYVGRKGAIAAVEKLAGAVARALKRPIGSGGAR